MTQACCPACRLRFSQATAAHLAGCPFCGGSLQPTSAHSALGFKLMAMDGEATGIGALAVALSAYPESDL